MNNECCAQWMAQVEFNGFAKDENGSPWASNGTWKIWGPWHHDHNCDDYDGAPID